MKLFKKEPLPLDPNPTEEAYKLLVERPSVEEIPEMVVRNPNPYRGIVATQQREKLMQAGVDNTLFWLKMGNREQAFSHLWNSFVIMCYRLGIDVDENGAERMKKKSTALTG